MTTKTEKLALMNFVKNVEVENEELYFVKNFYDCVSFVKNFFQYTQLKKIEIMNKDCYADRLTYTFSSPVHEEEIVVSAPITASMNSLKNLYENAAYLENNIGEQYNISFSN